MANPRKKDVFWPIGGQARRHAARADFSRFDLREYREMNNVADPAHLKKWLYEMMRCPSQCWFGQSASSVPKATGSTASISRDFRVSCSPRNSHKNLHGNSFTSQQKWESIWMKKMKAESI
jgi:hypothetical protein